MGQHLLWAVSLAWFVSKTDQLPFATLIFKVQRKFSLGSVGQNPENRRRNAALAFPLKRHAYSKKVDRLPLLDQLLEVVGDRLPGLVLLEVGRGIVVDRVQLLIAEPLEEQCPRFVNIIGGCFVRKHRATSLHHDNEK